MFAGMGIWPVINLAKVAKLGNDSAMLLDNTRNLISCY